MKQIISICKYIDIKYIDEGEYSTMNEDGKLIPEPAGWYFFGTRYNYNKDLDLSRYSGIPFTQLVEMQSEFLNSDVVVENLKSKNDVELGKAILAAKYWRSENTRFSISNPKISRMIQFYETIIYQFKRWYDFKELTIPETNSEPILQNPDKDGKILFPGTRMDFADKILKNFDNTNLSKKIRSEFKKYRFDFPWNQKACVSYVRKEKNIRDHSE